MSIDRTLPPCHDGPHPPLDDSVLVLGGGTVHNKTDLIKFARDKHIAWEQRDEVPGARTVSVCGDTAVVTAELWLKYKAEGKAVGRKLWFGDTYVRTPKGWRYAFGRTSLCLPPETP